MFANVDPRMAKLESWMATIHSGIFDTSMHAQSLVSRAQQSMRDVEEDDDDYLQLKRDYDVAVSVYTGKHQSIDQLIDATNNMLKRTDIPRLHFAQSFAAGTCAISCQRMLDAIPEDLQSDLAIVGDLRDKARGHFTMWRHLVGVVGES